MLTVWDRSVLMSPNTNDVMYLYFFRALSHIWCRSYVSYRFTDRAVLYNTQFANHFKPTWRKAYVCVCSHCSPIFLSVSGEKNRQNLFEVVKSWRMNCNLSQRYESPDHSNGKEESFFSAFTNDKRHITMTVEYITHKSLMSFIKLWYFIIWHGIHLLRICALGCV